MMASSKPRPNGVGMAELDWPEWPAVSVLASTHFNTQVKGRDISSQIIVETLEATPYAQKIGPVKKCRIPLLPHEIAKKKVASMVKEMETRWPLQKYRPQSEEASQGTEIQQVLSAVASTPLSTAKDKIPPSSPKYELALADEISSRILHEQNRSGQTVKQRPLLEPKKNPAPLKCVGFEQEQTSIDVKSRDLSLQVRLATFLAKDEHGKKVAEPLDGIEESTEMIERRRAAVEKASFKQENTLAVDPIDSLTAYCHPDVMQTLPNATASPTSPVRTEDMKTNALARQAEWEEVLGNQAVSEGDTAAAYRHYGRAVDLYDSADHRDPPEVSSVDHADVVLYSTETHMAAIRIQRNFRRHLRILSNVITKLKAAFRGKYQRYLDQAEARRESAAATFVQRPCHIWYRRRVRSSLKLQSRWRAKKSRDTYREKLYQRRLANFLLNMGPMFIGWLKLFRRKREERRARFLQHVWRGYKLRVAYAESVAERKAMFYDSSTCIQCAFRSKFASKTMKNRRLHSRQAEMIRASAELFWIRSAGAIATARYATARELKKGRWAERAARQEVKHIKFQGSTALERNFRTAFDHLDLEGSGALGYQEALGLLRRFGVPSSILESAECLVDLDSKVNGRIDCNALWRQLSEHPASHSCLSLSQWTRVRIKPRGLVAKRETRAYVRKFLVSSLKNFTSNKYSQAEFREQDPPCFQCPACRMPFCFFTDWWKHFDSEGRCLSVALPDRIRRHIVCPRRLNSSKEAIILLHTEIQAALLQYFDEMYALEHRALNAEVATHAARDLDKEAHKEFKAISCALEIRLSIIKKRSTVKRSFLQYLKRRKLDTSEIDLRNGITLIDVQNRGYLNKDEVSALFFVLVHDWSRVPIPCSPAQTNASRAAKCAVDAVFDCTRATVVNTEEILAWWNNATNSVSKEKIKPNRIYRRSTPSVLAHYLLLARARALAEQEEMKSFRAVWSRKSLCINRFSEEKLQKAGLFFLSDTYDNERIAWLTARANYTVALLAIIQDIAAHPPNIARASGGACPPRVCPEASANGYEAIKTSSNYLQTVGNPSNVIPEFAMSEIALHERRYRRCFWNPTIVIGTDGNDYGRMLPTENQLRKVQNEAEREARRHLYSSSGRIQRTIEVRHYSSILAAYDRRSLKKSEQNLFDCALAAIPIDTDGRGFVHLAEAIHLFQKRMGLDIAKIRERANLEHALSASNAGLVAVSNLSMWYAQNKHNYIKMGHGCRMSRLFKRHRVSSPYLASETVVARKRAAARGYLWSTVEHNAIKADDDLVQVYHNQLLHRRFERRTVANERDVLTTQIMSTIDRKLRRFLSMHSFHVHLEANILFCIELDTRLSEKAQNSKTNAQKAIVQSEFWFEWFDIDSAGKVSVYFLQDLLGRFGIKLSSIDRTTAEVAKSKYYFSFDELKAWLSTTSDKCVKKRLAMGWKKTHHRQLCMHAKQRLYIANQYRALLQIELAFAIEQKWKAMRDMTALNASSTAIEKAIVPTIEQATLSLEELFHNYKSVSTIYYRQRAGPFDQGTSESDILDRMLYHANESIRSARRGSISVFASNYLNSRSSLQREGIDNNTLVYRPKKSFSEIRNNFRKSSNNDVAPVSSPQTFPTSWHTCFCSGFFGVFPSL